MICRTPKQEFAHLSWYNNVKCCIWQTIFVSCTQFVPESPSDFADAVIAGCGCDHGLHQEWPFPGDAEQRTVNLPGALYAAFAVGAAIVGDGVFVEILLDHDDVAIRRVAFADIAKRTDDPQITKVLTPDGK